MTMNADMMPKYAPAYHPAYAPMVDPRRPHSFFMAFHVYVRDAERASNGTAREAIRFRPVPAQARFPVRTSPDHLPDSA